MAAATVRALRRGRGRVVHPGYALLPIELPVIGRLVAVLAARLVDTARGATEGVPAA